MRDPRSCDMGQSVIDVSALPFLHHFALARNGMLSYINHTLDGNSCKMSLIYSLLFFRFGISILLLRLIYPYRSFRNGNW